MIMIVVLVLNLSITIIICANLNAKHVKFENELCIDNSNLISYHRPNCQKATALAAATFKESTP